VSSAPQERAGAASAISETAAELGLALGVAVLGSIGAAVYRLNIAPAIPASLPDETRRTVMDTLAGALHAAGQLGADAPAVLDAGRAAFVDGVLVASAVSAAICLVVALLIVLVLWRAPPAPQQS
jgi:DHA2 family multidrug resistance protein-like MFS transporter